MKINKGSWHYRLVDEMSYPKDNLCQYVRQVLGWMGAITAMIFVVTLVVTILSYPLWRLWHQDGWIGFLSACIWLAIGFALIKAYRESWKTARYHFDTWKDHPAQLMNSINDGRTWDISGWWHNDLFAPIKQKWADRPAKPYVPKEPNIFMEYARAAHDKICPILEFKDD